MAYPSTWRNFARNLGQVVNETARVGGAEGLRVIAAANVDIQDAVEAGKFRDDLYYRLNVINSWRWFYFLNHNKLERRGRAVPINVKLKEVEKEVIAATLLRSQGNIKEAVTILGIDRLTLYEKIKMYNIEW